MSMPYNWRWKWYSWQTPPRDWKIPSKPADQGELIIIKSAINGIPISANALNDNISLRISDYSPVQWIKVPVAKNRYYLRSKNAPSLFFSYSSTSSGYGKLLSSPESAEYQFIDKGGFWNIKNHCVGGAKKEYTQSRPVISRLLT